MKRWAVYHREREYAREVGDPLLGYVLAYDREGAEREAQMRFGLPTGAWVRECVL